MRYLADLRLAHKFALLAALALLLSLPPIVYMLRGFHGAMTYAQGELQGIEPIRDIVKLMHLTQQHRGLSAAVLSGDTSMQPLRVARQAEVQQALDRALESTAALGDAKLDERRKALAEGWKSLTADMAAGMAPTASFARHTALIELQMRALSSIGDASGMILEPAPENYYVVAALLGPMAGLTEALGQARAGGAAHLAGKGGNADALLTMEAAGVRAHQSAAELADLLARAGAASKLVETTLGKAAGHALEQAAKAEKLIQDVSHGAGHSMPAKAYLDAMTVGIDAQFSLIEASRQHLDVVLRQGASNARLQFALAVAGALLLLGASAAIMLAIVRGTLATVRDVQGAAYALAEGDLGHRVGVRSRDELGQMADTLNEAIQRLAKVIGDIKAGGDSVSTAASQIASGNSDLSARTEATASNLEQTASAMEQMNASVRNNAETARQATQLAAAASDVAVRGGEVVGQVVSTMGEISTSSRKIADIIGVIDGIAFQTNILALNAAVEAARAGEQGRGFAVVAGEVRTLAKRSADAAREIKGLIGGNVDRVEAGGRLVGDAGRTMDEIVAQVRRVSDLIGEISAATEEQTTGIGQVNSAVSQLDQATQQNAALVEQSAAAAEGLKQQALKLMHAVDQFKVDHAAQPLPRPAAGPTRTAYAPVPAARSAAGDDWETF